MKNNKGKKGIIWILILALIFSLAGSLYVFGDETDDLNKINQERDNLSKQLSQGKAKSSQLASQIKSLEQSIYSSQLTINQLETEINSTKAEITQALADLEVKEKELQEQNADLNDRLRAMYKNGEVGMLSVLLGSASVSDFMTNMDIVQRIYNADANLLAQLQYQYEVLEEERNNLLALKSKLETQQTNLQEKKTAMAAQKTEVAAKKGEVDKDNAVLESQIDDLNKEADALIAQILSLQGTDGYVGGSMIWPAEASTRITSPFGNRLHPILKKYKMHTGIDIGAAGGTNILAANAGVVIQAGYNSSYGYMVMIDHGGGIVTLYAHSSKLLVKKGDVVKRGQVIAKVGSTGMSTGNHLHFEVRKDGKYVNPLNYVSTSVRK